MRLGEGCERIPLTIVDGDPGSGSVTVVIQEVGKSTADLVEVEPGDTISDVCGPLGLPSGCGRLGVCVLVAGGYGAAAVLPIAKELKARGNWVISILGARTKRLLVLEEELREVSDVVEIATDDGSAGTEGTVLVPLAKTIREWDPDHALAIGPLPMMAAVAGATREARIATVVSLNPIMLDGTGMCGACRVHVGGEVRFACVDGPEFDGHAVDFTELASRVGMYRDLEKQAWELRGG